MKVKSLALLAACAASGCTSTLYRVPVDAVLQEAELVSIEESRTDGPVSYRRDVDLDPSGAIDVVYLRRRPDGSEVAVTRAEYEGQVAPALERIVEALPETCAVWIERCPALRDAVARVIEEGAVFRGAASTGIRGRFFWCAPQGVRYERDLVDPVDTLAVFLVAAYEASPVGVREPDEVLDEPGRPTAELRARRHAEHVLRVVELFRSEAECLSLALLPDMYGATLRDWTAAVERADGDVEWLAAELLEAGDLIAWE